jgi:hypothetical protein
MDVEKWCSYNKMFINTKKTKYMTEGTRQKVSTQDYISLTLNSEPLQHTDCEKLLGIKVDSNLKWTNQVKHVCSLISMRLYLLSKIIRYLNLDARKLYYNGYILPLIDYCCVIWGNCNQDGLERLLKLQKRAARMILDADPLSPSDALFKQLKWMTVETRIHYHKCLQIYKCLCNEAPNYLSNLLKYVGKNNPYNLRNIEDKNLFIPKPKMSLFKNSFSYSGPKLWNQLPTTIRSSPNIAIFKYRLKKYFIKIMSFVNLFYAKYVFFVCVYVHVCTGTIISVLLTCYFKIQT